MRERARTTVLGMAVAALLGVTPAWAQSSSPQGPGWQFELTPYFWMAGLSGDVGVAGTSTSVDASFTDIVKNLDFGAVVAFEARNGPWALLLDGIYLKVSQNGDTPGPGFSRVDVISRTGIIAPALAYRVWESPFAALDAWIGTRIWVVDSELKFSGGVLPAQKFSGTKAWADPVAGARLRGVLSGKWSGVLLGDVGGFGAASDLTWQAFAGIAYQLSERWSLKAGYRAMGVDYESGGFKFDVIQHGPLIGLGFRF